MVQDSGRWAGQCAATPASPDHSGVDDPRADKLRITSADFTGNRIGHAGCAALAQVLEVSGELQHLNLSKNRVTSPALCALCHGLVVSSSLRSLALACNVFARPDLSSEPRPGPVKTCQPSNTGGVVSKREGGEDIGAHGLSDVQMITIFAQKQKQLDTAAEQHRRERDDRRRRDGGAINLASDGSEPQRRRGKDRVTSRVPAAGARSVADQALAARVMGAPMGELGVWSRCAQHGTDQDPARRSRSPSKTTWWQYDEAYDEAAGEADEEIQWGHMQAERGMRSLAACLMVSMAFSLVSTTDILQSLSLSQ